MVGYCVTCALHWYSSVAYIYIFADLRKSFIYAFCTNLNLGCGRSLGFRSALLFFSAWSTGFFIFLRFCLQFFISICYQKLLAHVFAFDVLIVNYVIYCRRIKRRGCLLLLQSL